MPRTYSQQEVESAVAISGDLHGHSKVDEFVKRHDQLRGASELWQLSIDAAIELEEMAGYLAVQWGETHDYFLVIETLVDEIIHQCELDIPAAVRASLGRCHSRGL